MARLSRPELASILRDLAGAFAGQGSRDLDGLLGGFYAVLHDFDAREVEAAAELAMREEKYFPTASRLLKLTEKVRRQHPQAFYASSPYAVMMAWAQGPVADGAPCPCCGSVLEERNGRLHVYHDQRLHHEQHMPRPIQGPTDDWRAATQ